MVYRVVVVLALPWLVLGCSDGMRDPRARAAICARSWKVKGFTFDADTMTCAEMFERAQAIRNAAYWRQRGYAFDPNIMTAGQMDRRAAEFRKSGVKVYPPPLTMQTETAEAEATAPEAVPVPEAATETPTPARPEDAEIRRMLQKMTIVQVRKKYPHYNDMDDMELTHAIHGRYFREVPFADFARRFLGGRP
ncbi:MAG: hypothetical protein GXY19_07815 [Phycisphaerae bacterium]|nr:hypothetical protein [Phycisphaerae bacterium]